MRFIQIKLNQNDSSSLIMLSFHTYSLVQKKKKTNRIVALNGTKSTKYDAASAADIHIRTFSLRGTWGTWCISFCSVKSGNMISIASPKSLNERDQNYKSFAAASWSSVDRQSSFSLAAKRTMRNRRLVDENTQTAANFVIYRWRHSTKN